jgi:anti-sigma-K factor RskA
LSADTYDRYVLGLLDAQDRATVESQLEQGCPVCIKGVQRSMNLWLVFANSLEQVEPSADFRARLVRIAGLSKRVLTVPKRNRRVREPAILVSSVVVVCIIVGLLLTFSWIAGGQSARQDVERAKYQFGLLQSQSAATELQLRTAEELNREMEQKPHASGHSDPSIKRLQDQLSAAQATIQQYQVNVTRDQQKTDDNSTLVTALAKPGVRLLRFINAEGTSSTAYAFVIENTRVVFVASKVPPPAAGHQYQLWLVRKDEPRYVAAGIFTPTDDKAVVVTYDEDKEAINSLAGLLVTEEDITGTYTTPSSTHILETPGATTPPAPAADQD